MGQRMETSDTESDYCRIAGRRQLGSRPLVFPIGKIQRIGQGAAMKNDPGPLPFGDILNQATARQR